MRMKNKEKIPFICFLIVSIFYYICALSGIISKDGSDWIVNLCLGSAFLCLAATYLHKNNNDKKDK